MILCCNLDSTIKPFGRKLLWQKSFKYFIIVNQYLFGKAREFSDLRHLCAYSRGNSGISASARQQKDFSAKTISFLTYQHANSKKSSFITIKQKCLLTKSTNEIPKSRCGYLIFAFHKTNVNPESVPIFNYNPIFHNNLR